MAFYCWGSYNLVLNYLINFVYLLHDYPRVYGLLELPSPPVIWTSDEIYKVGRAHKKALSTAPEFTEPFDSTEDAARGAPARGDNVHQSQESSMYIQLLF